MIIKKYIAKTEIEAIEKAKEELGGSAIVMNVKTLKPRGLKRIFLRSKVEVTAALDDNTTYSNDTAKAAPKQPVDRSHGSRIDLSIPPISGVAPLEPTEKSAGETKEDSAEKQTNEERLSMLFSLLEKQMEEKSKADKKPSDRQPEKRSSEAAQPAPKASDDTERRKMAEERPRPAETARHTEERQAVEPATSDKDEKKEKSAVYRELIYKQLLQNEVDPSIVDTILDEVEHSLPKDAAVDQMLGSVYQRIILMIGQPYTIKYRPNEPTKFVFFLGSTGVGKTTTIAKIASRLKLEQNCNLALVTADTYRVAAVEQLRVYADILSVPLNVVYNPEELGAMIDELEKYDVVLVDTAGCSHKNKEQIGDVKTLLEQVPISKRQVYLALSVGTKYKDLKEIAEVYSKITDYSIIFTKLDETSSAGVMLNMKMSTKCPLSYVTNGQQVPDDIAVIDAQTVAKQLLS